MTQAGVVHVIGAGLAGLAAAVRLALAGRRVEVHEAARFAGGRCRSYFEPALGITIDNGNHLVLSGNRAALDYLKAVGGEALLVASAQAEFPFADLRTDERWALRINDGPIPWWLLVPSRRVPQTRFIEYLALAKLLRPRSGQTIGEAIGTSGALYDRLWRPVLLSALNTDPMEASAELAGAVVRESLAKGGAACRPMIAEQGLAAAFVEPALKRLGELGVPVRFDHRLREIVRGDDRRVTRLAFAEGDHVDIGADDRVVLAVPAPVAAVLLPEVPTPNDFRAIVNAHYQVVPPPGCPRLLGVVGGLTEWLFAFHDRLSVTISGADHLIERSREDLARAIWDEVARLAGVAGDMPPWQIIKERRATFAATPEQARRRPTVTAGPVNLALAGDWTDTGLPATIEGAIRSGFVAAEVVLRPIS